MEFLSDKRSLLIIAMALMAAACSKESELIISSESVDMRFNESMEWNKKHLIPEIVVDSDDYSLLAMADCHVGGTTNLDKFFKIAEEEKPSAVIMDGDLTGGLTENYNLFENHTFLNDSVKLFFVIGNHDLWYNGWGEFYSRFGSSSYYFTISTPAASDLYICLDTGGSTLGHLQMEWLKNLLESQRSDYRRCVIITHINLFRPRHTTSTNLVNEELNTLINLFTEHRVDMVITGHDHKRDAEVFGVTTYIQVDALADGLSYAGYLNLKVKNGNIGYSFENINR
jgi:predicted phosphodiesterase